MPDPRPKTSDDRPNGEVAPNVWALVPARGGSKGIPHKNLRRLGDKPLVQHVLTMLAQTLPRERVILSTEDPSIAACADGLARVLERPDHLAGDAVTLDEVAAHVARTLLSEGAAQDDILLTVQPTSPFLSAASVLRAVEVLDGGPGTGGPPAADPGTARAPRASVISVKEDRRLRWGLDEQDDPKPLFAERVNRQWLPREYEETGGLIGARLGAIVQTGTRIIDPVGLLELDQFEGLDIDTYEDWLVAEYYAGRLKILIRADGGVDLGMGHVYRALALQNELHGHDLVICTLDNDGNAPGVRFLKERSNRVVTVDSEDAFKELLDDTNPDICVLDILDTELDYTRQVKDRTGFLVCIENLGPGIQIADLVINDLYTDPYPSENHWYGVVNALLAPQFEALRPRPATAEKVERVLVTFGGSDPRDLTRLALTALQRLAYPGHVTVVLGPSYSHEEPDPTALGLAGEVVRDSAHMASLMRDADLALTSGGRTVAELMVLGVPTITLCQNQRELLHTHASAPFGVVNLGLGEFVSAEALAEHIRTYIDDRKLRSTMRDRMLGAVKRRSNRDIVRRMLEAARAADEKE